jgi:hypothetical protein
MTCGRGGNVVRVAGDFDGDGYADLFITRGDEVAWAMSDGSGELRIEAGATRRGSIAQWKIAAGNHLIVGDFLQAGYDMVFAHRGNTVVVLDYNEGAPRLQLFEDEFIGDGIPDSGEGWELGPSDRFLAVRFADPIVKRLVVTDGTDLALLEVVSEQETFKLVVLWTDSIRDQTRGELPTLRAGRTFADGTQSIFDVSAGSGRAYGIAERTTSRQRRHLACRRASPGRVVPLLGRLDPGDGCRWRRRRGAGPEEC